MGARKFKFKLWITVTLGTHRRAAPTFVPSAQGLNCDPLHEIEERVLVSTPIHNRRRASKTSKVRVAFRLR